ARGGLHAAEKAVPGVTGKCCHLPSIFVLLSSPRLKELLDEARRAYDVILLDSSPLLAVVDSAIVGAVVDGVVLVARPGTLRRRDVEHALELLRIGGVSILGMLVNGVSREERSYSYDYISYGRPIERRSGDVARSIGAEDQPPGIVTPGEWTAGPPARMRSRTEGPPRSLGMSDTCDEHHGLSA
ncbi:MAG TPA: hypothetical protein VKP69_16470, partial [Isosphaeraceae bacterium]|nr:hypothetical protein [Isosphaeraceae bacterium]